MVLSNKFKTLGQLIKKLKAMKNFHYVTVFIIITFLLETIVISIIKSNDLV